MMSSAVERDHVRTEAAGRLEGVPFRTRQGATVLIRHCRGHAELDACVRLQQATWGYGDLETAPRKFFLLAQELGGQVIGAFDGAGELVAFAMAMAAFEAAKAPKPTESGSTKSAGRTQTPDQAPMRPSEPFLHSHMLAVHPSYRDSGLGTRLKLVQREDAIARGIRRMTWTFDPLAAKNAYLNLHRLGAVARRYSPDFYGVSSSRLQGGLPTDRLHVDWWLSSAHVRGRLGEVLPRPTVPPAEVIALPAEIDAWRADDSASSLERVRAAQAHLQAAFSDAFAQGLIASDFLDGQYTLERPEQILDETERTHELNAR